MGAVWIWSWDRRRAAPRTEGGGAQALLTADVELAGEEGLDVPLFEQARIAGEAVLETGERKPDLHDIVEIEPRAQAVQDAGGEGIAGPDPVDDPGDHDLVGLRRALTAVDPRRNAMGVGIDDVARGRRDHVERGKLREHGVGGLSAPLLPFPDERAAEQQRYIAMIAEQYVCLADEPAQHLFRVAVPFLPELGAIIAVERDQKPLRVRRLGRRDRSLGAAPAQSRRDPGKVQQIRARKQSFPIEIARPGEGKAASLAVVDDIRGPEARPRRQEIKPHPPRPDRHTRGRNAVAAQMAGRRVAER